MANSSGPIAAGQTLRSTSEVGQVRRGKQCSHLPLPPVSATTIISTIPVKSSEYTTTLPKTTYTKHRHNGQSRYVKVASNPPIGLISTRWSLAQARMSMFMTISPNRAVALPPSRSCDRSSAVCVRLCETSRHSGGTSHGTCTLMAELILLGLELSSSMLYTRS